MKRVTHFLISLIYANVVATIFNPTVITSVFKRIAV